MNKNIQMLKIFFGVLSNKQNIIDLVIPNSYQKTIYDIDYLKLKKLGYKNLLFDIDNTIMPVNSMDVDAKLKKLFDKLKKDFKICLMSNNDLKRVYKVLETLEVNGIALSEKPKKQGFDRAMKIVNGNVKETVMIGDQMLTDVYGGNNYGLFTILVEPFLKKYTLKTGINRILQNIMMKKINKITRYKYY